MKRFGMIGKSILLGLGAAALLLSACQRTPEKPVVIQKDMEQMLEMAMATPAPAAAEAAATTGLYAQLGAPTQYAASISAYDGKLRIDGTANVLLPAVEAIPTVRVNKRLFTQAEADRYREALLGGATLYAMPEYSISKAEAEERLLRFYGMRDGSIPLDLDGEDPQDTEKLRSLIEMYEELVRTLPDEAVPVPASTALQPMERAFNPGAQGIEGTAEVGGKEAYFYLNNGFFNENNVVFTYNAAGARTHDPYQALWSQMDEAMRADFGECALPQAEAERIGGALLAAMGITGMTLDAIEPAGRVKDAGIALAPGQTPSTEILGRGYALDYTRVVDGVALTRTRHTGTHSKDEGAAIPWQYEKLHLTVAEDGSIAFLQYTSPYALAETVTAQTAMLPFSEIVSVFEKMAPLPYSYMQSAEREHIRHFTLTEVRLGLMRVTEKNRRDVALLIPVWDFMADYEDGGGQINHSVVLTINAIDGTVIDRDMGY